MGTSGSKRPAGPQRPLPSDSANEPVVVWPWRKLDWGVVVLLGSLSCRRAPE